MYMYVHIYFYVGILCNMFNKKFQKKTPINFQISIVN